MQHRVKLFNIEIDFEAKFLDVIGTKVNGVGIFYLHLILIVQENSYSIHVKTVVLALEALSSKKNVGSSPRLRILP